MKGAKTVNEYISKNEKWAEGLQILQELTVSTELEESIKWGTPHYTIDGKIVVGIVAFKEHFALWFHQGVFLSDPDKKLINAQEGTTKGMRQWRFTSVEEIDPKMVRAYLLEAIENQKAGKMIQPEPKKVSVPIELEKALDKTPELSAQFDSLTSYKQKEYNEYIGSAKQEKTRLSRLEKSIPLILEGKGLNDQYR